MSKKLSRRDFARTSVAAGAAAVAVPGALLGTRHGARGHVRRSRRARSRKRVRAAMPPDLDYGGLNLDGRDVTMLADTLTPAGQAKPNYPNGWVEGTTIPQEYYVDEKHYPNDEQFLKDHFWFMIDHHSRIPKPGDYFTYQYGRGDSIIVVRDKDNEVKAFHNVCRHRGSRLCVEQRAAADGGEGERQAAPCEFLGGATGTERQHSGVPLSVSRVDLRHERGADLPAAGRAGGLRSVAVRAAPRDPEGAGRVHLRHLRGRPAGFQHVGRESARGARGIQDGGPEDRGAPRRSRTNATGSW